MANIFDQFDGAPAAAPNPFDQFDASSDEMQASAAPSVTTISQAAPPQQSFVDKLFGINGPRYETWPERMARNIISGATLPGQVMKEAEQPKTTISDSDVSALSVPSVLGLAALANPTEGFAPRPTINAPLTGSQTPSVAQLESAAQSAYNAPAVKAVQFTPEATQNLAGSIGNELLANRVDAYNAPQVSGIIDRLNQPRFGPNPTIDDLEMARQSLNNVPPTEYRAAQIAKGQIDNYLSGNIAQNDLLAGDANAANDLLIQARGNWAAAQRARDIDRALHNADIQAGSTYSGGNLNNATRQQLRPLLKVKKGQRTFTPPGWTQDETDQLAQAVLGTKTGNIARMIGKVGPEGKLGFISHLIAAHETGGASIPFSAAAIAAKKIGEASTNRQAQLLSQMLRSRSPLAQSMQTISVASTPFSPQALAATILARSGAGVPALYNGVPSYANGEQPY